VLALVYWLLQTVTVSHCAFGKEWSPEMAHLDFRCEFMPRGVGPGRFWSCWAHRPNVVVRKSCEGLAAWDCMSLADYYRGKAAKVKFRRGGRFYGFTASAASLGRCGSVLWGENKITF
jgi:hypothetical protein